MMQKRKTRRSHGRPRTFVFPVVAGIGHLLPGFMVRRSTQCPSLLFSVEKTEVGAGVTGEVHTAYEVLLPAELLPPVEYQRPREAPAVSHTRWLRERFSLPPRKRQAGSVCSTYNIRLPKPCSPLSHLALFQP